MRKLFSMLSVLILMLSFAGCAGNPSVSPAATTSPTAEQLNATTETQNVTTFPETTAKPVITDYSIAGMMNVTDVHFSGKTSTGSYSEIGYNGVDTTTAITVWIMCPQCGEETFDIINFPDISENLIGQQTFSWTGEEDCANWSNHSDVFDSSYKYSIIFTLNG